MRRIYSIDALRGLVMVIMVLDHVRDFFHITSLSQSPTDLATTTPELFFTRWVTHLCAPVFVFLSGTSAFISYSKTGNLSETRRFLLKRGASLLLIDFTVVNFGIWFDIHFNVFIFNVLSAIGFGFIVLGLLLKLPSKSIGILGIIIIFLHNLAALIPVSESSLLSRIINPFFGPGAIPLGGGKLFIMGYSPVPWLGILLTGFASGRFFFKETEARRKTFLRIGLSAVSLFIVLRFINIYGDPVPWQVQSSSLYTFLSFINLTKYPPSLDFCLLFLSIMFLLLCWIEGRKNTLTDFLSVYGKVPLFYFITHWYMIHPLLLLFIFLRGYSGTDLVFGFNFGRPENFSGYSLGIIYLLWLATVVAFYPLCKRYARYKQSHPEIRWLRYL